MKNLIEKNQEILMTKDGYLVSKWFAMPMKFTRDYNQIKG